MDKLGLFGAFLPIFEQLEYSQKIWLRQLLVLMVPQLHAKYQKKTNEPILRKTLS